MRYDKKVIFVKETGDKYNYSSGNYESGELELEERFCDITDAGAETMNLLYGKVVQGAKIVRVKTKLYDIYDYLLIDGKKYQIQMVQAFRQDQYFHVMEQL